MIYSVKWLSSVVAAAVTLDDLYSSSCSASNALIVPLRRKTLSSQRRSEAVGTPSRVPEWVWKRVPFHWTRNGESPTTKRAATVSWYHQLSVEGMKKVVETGYIGFVLLSKSYWPLIVLFLLVFMNSVWCCRETSTWSFEGQFVLDWRLWGMSWHCTRSRGHPARHFGTLLFRYYWTEPWNCMSDN